MEEGMGVQRMLKKEAALYLLKISANEKHGRV
jgi:hypothetical protein